MLDPLEIAAEPNRRRLLQPLAGGERTMTALAAEFTVSRSAISQHLLLLEQAGLVIARKDGRNRLYRPDPAGMNELRRLFDQFWTHELEQLRPSLSRWTSTRRSPDHPAGAIAPLADGCCPC
ncbi:metalloregulator ArsR/SmtB family transcription factor [Micrococcaceae bacterium Sec5.7]